MRFLLVGPQGPSGFLPLSPPLSGRADGTTFHFGSPCRRNLWEPPSMICLGEEIPNHRLIKLAAHLALIPFLLWMWDWIQQSIFLIYRSLAFLARFIQCTNWLLDRWASAAIFQLGLSLEFQLCSSKECVLSGTSALSFWHRALLLFHWVRFLWTRICREGNCSRHSPKNSHSSFCTIPLFILFFPIYRCVQVWGDPAAPLLEQKWQGRGGWTCPLR